VGTADLWGERYAQLESGPRGLRDAFSEHARDIRPADPMVGSAEHVRSERRVDANDRRVQRKCPPRYEQDVTVNRAGARRLECAWYALPQENCLRSMEERPEPPVHNAHSTGPAAIVR
jgi:hypothetical protein